MGRCKNFSELNDFLKCGDMDSDLLQVISDEGRVQVIYDDMWLFSALEIDFVSAYFALLNISIGDIRG